MRIKLSDHFNCRKLIRFTLPSVVMMIFTSIYSVVDGLFVSNFVTGPAVAFYFALEYSEIRKVLPPKRRKDFLHGYMLYACR